MIEIRKEEYKLFLADRQKIKDRLIKHTCKTNLNPHLLFRNKFTEDTSKIFIGNWTDDGFWVTRFRRQIINFRADIVAKGVVEERSNDLLLHFKYSLGFSSIIGGLISILVVGLFLNSLGLGLLWSALIPAPLYILLSYFEVSKMKSVIYDYLINEYLEK